MYLKTPFAFINSLKCLYNKGELGIIFLAVIEFELRAMPLQGKDALT
jgi:hypothetical protein